MVAYPAGLQKKIKTDFYNLHIILPFISFRTLKPAGIAHRIQTMIPLAPLKTRKLLGQIIFNLNFVKSVSDHRFIISNAWRVHSDHVDHMLFRDQHLLWVLYSEFELRVLF